MTPSKPVRVVTHGISQPVRIVTHGISDPVRIGNKGDPVRVVTDGISDPVRIVAGVWPPVPPQPHFDFNPSLVTFTPSMAKRATSVFAAAPIVQGKRDGTGTPDSLVFSSGNLIFDKFYSNLDWTQGAIVFWLTPEWNNADGKYHTILRASNDNGIRIWKDNANNTQLSVGGLTLSISYNWVAGTKYCVVCRWDSKNPIDGTNYACISIDDAHAFGVASAPTIGTGTDGSIGSYAGILYAADAIIEGLTIYRRVLYDGAYGTDVGNGDEVAQIAAGVDPTTITGSWDCVFALPTDSTPGALVTG